MPPRSRPSQVTITALVATIGSGLAISLGVFAALAGSYSVAGAPAPPRSLLVAFPLILLGFGAWGLVTARGLLRLQPWSRRSILVFSGLLAFLGAMGTFFILTTNIPVPQGFTPQQFNVIRDAVTIVYFMFLAVGVWWLVEFNSANIKAAFRERGKALPAPPAPSEEGNIDQSVWRRVQPPAEQEEPAPSPRPAGFARTAKAARPLSITVIGWYLLAGTVSSGMQILMGVPASIFGMTLAGPPASMLYLAMFGAQAYLGIELLHLQPLSRILSIYFFLFGFVNTALFVGLPGREARLAAMVRAFPASMQPPPGTSPTMAWWLPLISAGIATALPIWFLITRKDAFAKPDSQQH